MHLIAMESAVSMTEVDFDVLQLVRAKDVRAFESLVRTFDGEMVKLAYVIGREIELAQDAAQDAWSLLWRRPPELRDRNQLRTWLLSVTANNARQTMRRRRIGRRLINQAAEQTPSDRSAEMVELSDLLARLPVEDRQAIGLRLVLGFSTQETASIMGLSESALRSRLHRALRTLRREER
jgi:RNA polymerase sigma-70 factor, ECF subfamily